MTRTFKRTIGVRPYTGHRFAEDGKVYIEWRAGGKRKQRIIGPNTKTVRDAADELLEQAIAEARSPGRGAASDLTLGALFDRYLADAETRPGRHGGRHERLRPRTLGSYREYARAVFRWFDRSMPARSLTKGAVRQWITAGRERGLAEGTIARQVDHVRQVYAWAVGEVEILEVNPLSGLKSPRRTTRVPAYTPDEIERFGDAVDGLPGRAWRIRLLYYVLRYYGVRAQQALHLRWDDLRLDLDDGRITWRAASPGSKGQEDRTLPMVAHCRDPFRRAWAHRVGEWVFWNHQAPARPSTYQSLHKGLRALEDAAGVAHVEGRAFHAFRRALVTRLIEEKGVAAAAAWIGDTADVLMRTYLRKTDDAVQSALTLVEGGQDNSPQSGDRMATSGEPGEPGAHADVG